MAECHAVGFAAVLAADADFQIAPRLAAALDADFHQAADAVEVDHLERVFRNQVVLHVVADEAAVVVAAHAQTRPREVIRTEAEELSFLSDLVGSDGGARQFDHRADEILHLDAFFGEDFLAKASACRQRRALVPIPLQVVSGFWTLPNYLVARRNSSPTFQVGNWSALATSRATSSMNSASTMKPEKSQSD